MIIADPTGKSMFTHGIGYVISYVNGFVPDLVLVREQIGAKGNVHVAGIAHDIDKRHIAVGNAYQFVTGIGSNELVAPLIAEGRVQFYNTRPYFHIILEITSGICHATGTAAAAAVIDGRCTHPSYAGGIDHVVVVRL